MKAIGWSIHRDLYNCKNTAQSAAELMAIVRRAARIAGLNVAKVVGDDFSPEEHGDNSGSSAITLVYKLAESHLGIHTWPLKSFVSIDFYTCGSLEDARRAVDMITEVFAPASTEEHVHERGRWL